MEERKTDASKTKMTIIEGLCWKCNEAIKVAVTEGDGIMSSYCGPDEFTDAELDFAKSKGVVIRTQDSKMANETYLANTCPHCNTFVGNFYLFTQYIQPADIGEYKFVVYVF